MSDPLLPCHENCPCVGCAVAKRLNEIDLPAKAVHNKLAWHKFFTDGWILLVWHHPDRTTWEFHFPHYGKKKKKTGPH